MKRKYSVFLAHVGTFSDRYCAGYSDKRYEIEDLFDRVKSIPLLSAVDIALTPDVIDKKDEIVKNLKRTGLKVASVCMDSTADRIFSQGSFSSLDPGVRRKTLEDAKSGIDFAAEVGTGIFTIWPGQDGYDYMFQADYIKERELFAEGIAACCEYRKDINITLEYKLKEPRTHSYISSIGTTLLMIEKIGAKNLGVVIDVGHAVFGYETPGETVALCKIYGDRLMHIHMNDNYSLWDDDMICGSVHTINYLEFIYWLRRTNYEGYITFDQFPYREDSRDAVAESAKWFDYFESLMDKADMEEIETVLVKKNAVESSRLMRKILMGQA